MILRGAALEKARPKRAFTLNLKHLINSGCSVAVMTPNKVEKSKN